MELDLIHEQLIEEENVNINDLPEEIKRKLKGFNLLKGRLKNNPQDVKLKNTAQRTSVNIADEIQTWLETDFDENEEEEDKGGNDDTVDKSTSSTPKSTNTPPAPKSSNSHPASVIPNNNTTENAPKRFGNLVMEKKILSVISANGGRIDAKSLRDIIQKEPNYPTQEVHSIVLKKVFLSSAYKLA